ncbi:hypothetical protein [Planomonospora algeriensis]
MRFPSRLAATALAASMAAAVCGGPARAAEPALTDLTFGGVHNAYERAAYPYLVDALDAGNRMIEIDLWTFFGQWTVSHSNPFWSDNNCERGATPANCAIRRATSSSRTAWTTSEPGTRRTRGTSSWSSNWR